MTNPELVTLDIIPAKIPTVDVSDCPKLQSGWEGRMRQSIEKHTNCWKLSAEQLHELYDTTAEELFLSFSNNVLFSP